MTLEGKLWLSGSVAVTSALLTVVILISRLAGGEHSPTPAAHPRNPTAVTAPPPNQNARNYDVLTTPEPIPRPMPVGYQDQFCDPPNGQMPEGGSFRIILEAGCFSGPITIPKKWGPYNVDKKVAEHGDWAVMWCAGRTKPEKFHPFYEDFADGDFKNCSTFYLSKEKAACCSKTWLLLN